MITMTSQITGVSIVYLTVCSGADRRKHKRSASLAFVRGIHRWPVNSPRKGPVTRKMYPFDDVIMSAIILCTFYCNWAHKHHPYLTPVGRCLLLYIIIIIIIISIIIIIIIVLYDNVTTLYFLQFSTSLKKLIDNWNITTTKWLRHTVYCRVSWQPTFMVFLISAFWHGFYPGYYLCFTSGVILTFAARKVSFHGVTLTSIIGNIIFVPCL